MKGGQNKTPIVWNGKRYKSRAELEETFGLTKGYLSYYLREDKPFKGYYLDYSIN